MTGRPSESSNKSPPKLFYHLGFTRYDDLEERAAFKKIKEAVLRAVNMDHSIKFTNRPRLEQDYFLNIFVTTALAELQAKYP
jgi:hypothetical protein